MDLVGLGWAGHICVLSTRVSGFTKRHKKQEEEIKLEQNHRAVQ